MRMPTPRLTFQHWNVRLPISDAVYLLPKELTQEQAELVQAQLAIAYYQGIMDQQDEMRQLLRESFKEEWEQIAERYS